MAASRQPKRQSIYQLKVTLKGIRPAIWRRLQVPGDMTLHRLHLILQVVVGWSNSHLYRFDINGAHFGEPDPEYAGYGVQMKDAKRAKLSRVAPSEKARFTYEYDFGDSWIHEIRVERISPAESGEQYPVCLAGKRACPPEDCGGIGGYGGLLEAIEDPTHEEHEEMMEWLGGYFDPEQFDVEETNRTLRGGVVQSQIDVGRKIGRNDPCPCGSGKRYKDCCGRVAEPPAPPDRRLMERDLRAIHKLIESQQFESVEEINTFLRGVTAKGDVPQWKAETRLEEAQEIVYQALEAEESRERIRLAMDALKISQDCTDAYVMLAEEAAEMPERARDWYQRGVEAAERVLGPDVFTGDVGHFWGLIETRPYMRAREGLAECLFFLGEHDAAIEHYRDMLRLNPNDNQGIRYKLLGCLMEKRDVDAAEEVPGQFTGETTAVWLFTRTLAAFIRKGGGSEARHQVADAVKETPYAVAYLLGRKRLPRTIPDYITMGDRSEAVAYVAEFGANWLDTPGALDWLRMASLARM